MKRIATIEKEKCNPVGCGDYLCIRMCPNNRAGKECKVKGPDGKVQINEEMCNDGCRVCVNICPFGAIHLIKLPDKLTQRPIHRYGKDGFTLFNLPVPIFGKVVGVLGVNGIGKSTAVQVLANLLEPNFGEDSGFDIDRLIKMFRGSEAQIYFEKMKKDQIKVSFKPQAVDKLTSNSKVNDLLKKADEKGNLKKIIEELDLKEILDHKLSEVSGGELQRIAIAAASAKDANVYIFDEPTSFLDIKQRIKVSKFIRSLANEKTSVLVVEHDLIILDYMTDLIQILYGESGAYGIVSSLKPTRAAINTYLEGFIREDNVRFRDYKISFEQYAQESKKKEEELISWKNLSAKLGKFELSSKEGTIPKGHMVGMIGENGIGKTSFVKALAGVIKVKGEISSSIKVAYKPQYLSTDSEDLVSTFLGKVNDKIMDSLMLKHLLAKKLIHLSGGELQRVAIAKCLTQKADIFLFDEPSAYLDVEQRLRISKIIREHMEHSGRTALVVDHDLLFLDYLSDKLSVVTGKPALKGEIQNPLEMGDGMNRFLKELGITLRRDPDSNRPRINKTGSVKDREQKSNNRYYYAR